jgi:hypothetical protein
MANCSAYWLSTVTYAKSKNVFASAVSAALLLCPLLWVDRAPSKKVAGQEQLRI